MGPPMHRRARWTIIAIWSAIVLPVDGLVAWRALQQWRTSGFSATQGVITHSEVDTHRQSDGTFRSADIRFRYTVSGVQHESDTYRFAPFTSSEGLHATRTVARYPRGAAVDVHYDPVAPDRAVLEKGLGQIDLVLPFFLVPFNVVMVFLWRDAAATDRRRRFSHVGGYRLIDEGSKSKLLLHKTTATDAALMTAGAISVVGLFPLAMLNDRLPQDSIAIAWGVLLLGTGAALLAVAILHALGHFDLVVDRARQVVRLPATSLFDRPIEVPLHASALLAARRPTTGVRMGDRPATELMFTYENADEELIARPITFRYREPTRLRDVGRWLGNALPNAVFDEASS